MADIRKVELVRQYRITFCLFYSGGDALSYELYVEKIDSSIV